MDIAHAPGINWTVTAGSPWLPFVALATRLVVTEAAIGHVAVCSAYMSWLRGFGSQVQTLPGE